MLYGGMGWGFAIRFAIFAIMNLIKSNSLNVGDKCKIQFDNVNIL